MWDSILLLDQTLYLIKCLKDGKNGFMNCADNCHTQYELVVLCTISTTSAVAWTPDLKKAPPWIWWKGWQWAQLHYSTASFIVLTDLQSLLGRVDFQVFQLHDLHPEAAWYGKKHTIFLSLLGNSGPVNVSPLVFYPANTHVRLVFLALLTKNQCVKDSRPECTRWIIQQLQLLLCRFTLFYHLLQKSSLYNQYIQVIAASFHCLFILIAQTEGRKTFLWPQWYVNSKRLARFRTCRNKHSICLVQTK